MEANNSLIHKEIIGVYSFRMDAPLLTSSTFPVVLSFQQKWIRESSDCWMYTLPLRLSGVTVFPLRVILPARNSTRYLLEVPLDPLTKLGKRAPDDIFFRSGPWKEIQKLLFQNERKSSFTWNTTLCCFGIKLAYLWETSPSLQLHVNHKPSLINYHSLTLLIKVPCFCLR